MRAMDANARTTTPIARQPGFGLNHHLIGDPMFTHYGNTQFAEATLPELELNKETLQDLEVDGSQVKGGALSVVVGTYSCVVGPVPVAPGTIRYSGTSVINPSGG